MALPASTILGLLIQSNCAGNTSVQGDGGLMVRTNILSALNTYITNNVTMVGTFVGAMIAYPFTPITAPVSGIMINGAPIMSGVGSWIFSDPKGGDGSIEWLSWLQSLYSIIDTSIIVGVPGLLIPTGSIPAFIMTAPTFSRSSLKSAYDSNPNDSSGLVLDALAKGIMQDMRSFFTISFPAIYATAYSGVCTINSVITP